MRLLLVLPALAAALLAGCPGRPPKPPLAGAGPPALVEIASEAGVRWRHNPGRSGRKFLPETMGGGGGFLDYNGDGRLDILCLNGASLPGYRSEAPRHALYRGNADGTFTDVSREAGLTSSGYAMGAAAGDYDGDGWTDLFLTGVGFNRLLRNRAGRFTDVTATSGIRLTSWTTGAAWIDYDHDQRPDLFVAAYVEWSPGEHVPCGSADAPQYCPPFQYRSAAPSLWRNLGNGRFLDVSRVAGILGHSGKTLGVTPCDVNDDGRTDLFLANDTEPDVLLLNTGRGGFAEKALTVGVALGSDGRATGSMGVDAAQPFNDGRQAIAVGNFIGQGTSLFVATPVPAGADPLFDNRKQEAGLAEPTLPSSTFGTLFEDVDQDGRPDLLLLNGHLDENLAVAKPGEPYRQLPQLFQNRGDGTFAEVAAAAGLTEPLVGRGLATGDIDNDGLPDFLAFENGGPVRLWHNRSRRAGAWIGLELEGVRSPRDGSGARVTVQAGVIRQTRVATTARSYLAVNDARMLFGLAAATAVEATVRWPAGATQSHRITTLDRYLRLREGSEEPLPPSWNSQP